MINQKICNLTLNEPEAFSVFLLLKKCEETLDEYSRSVLARLESFLYTSMSIEAMEELLDAAKSDSHTS